LDTADRAPVPFTEAFSTASVHSALRTRARYGAGRLSLQEAALRRARARWGFRRARPRERVRTL